MKALQALGALRQILRWVWAQKKAIEAQGQAYLTAERAAEWRLASEKLFYALEHGNGNLTMLPKWARWLFSQTTLDNQVGLFGQRYLKSSKLAANDPALKEPLPVYPAQ